MVLTEDMELVMNLVQNTQDNVFITGKAGSGKKCMVTAPTGIAAINAGGVTLHSLFGIPFGPITPYDHLENKFSEYKVELLLQMEVLIIDEISMVRPDILDVVDRKLRWVYESDEPFGGV